MMKKSVFRHFPEIFMIGALAVEGVAMACPHDQQRFICPQDPVVDANGNTGSVIGINIQSQEASVAYTNTYMSNAVEPIQSLALGLGCIGSLCVGDSAYDSNGNSGSIIGLNPYNYRAVIKYDNTYMSNSVVPIENMALGRGCLSGYCVNDRVVDSNGNLGTLAAINYTSNQIVIKYDNTYMSNSVVAVQSALLGLGCSRGNCVGDKGSDSNGNAATIVAINPFTGALALQYDNTYMSNSVIGASGFMSSMYCTTYGDSNRGVDSYIETHGDRARVIIYSSQNSSGGFYFSVSRQ